MVVYGTCVETDVAASVGASPADHGDSFVSAICAGMEWLRQRCDPVDMRKGISTSPPRAAEIRRASNLQLREGILCI